MAEQETLGAVEDMDDWSGTSEQDAMVDDFADGIEEVLVDEDGKPVSTDANPEEGIEEETTEENTQETENGEKGGKEQDPLTAEFFKDGDFDADKAIDFFGLNKDQGAQAQQPIPPEPPKPPEQPIQPQPQVDEFEQIKQQRLGWVEQLNQALAGKNVNDPNVLINTLNEVAARQQAEVKELIDNRRYEKQREEFEQRQKEFEEKMATKELEPRAESNLQAIANELKLSGADKAKAFFFDPKYGGQHLQSVFEFASQFKPEWKNAKGEAAKEAYKQFLVQYTSDMDRVRALSDFAVAKLQKQSFPELIKRARAIASKQQQASTQASNKGSKIQTRQQVKPSPSKGDEISDWLGGADSRIASL